MLLRCIYTDRKYPHVYTLSISTSKNQGTKASGALYIPTYVYNYKVITRGDKYYKNITSLIGANVRIQRYVHVWTVQKGAHEIAGEAASQQGGARMGLELQLICLLHRSKLSPQQEESPSVLSFETWTWGSRGVRTPPARGNMKAKWQVWVSTCVTVGLDYKHEIHCCRHKHAGTKGM